MANANRYFKTPFAESGNKTEVPDVSVGGAVGYDTGFGPDYELPQGSSDRKRIERDMYNGVQNSITSNLKQWQEGLYPTWIEDTGSGVPFSYPISMIVSHAGSSWISNESANEEEPGVGSKWDIYVPNSSSGVSDPSLIYTVATIDSLVNNATIFPFGKEISVVERSAGNGGGATWYAIETSTVTPSPSHSYGNVVQSLVNPTISFILEGTSFPGAIAVSTNYNVKQWGASGNKVDADNLAVQAVFDSIEQYSTDTQDSGAFQTPISIYFPDGDYLFNAGVSKSYRNNMTIYGTGKIWAGATFSDDYMMELIACSHMVIEGLFFAGDSYNANSALRVSGDGFTGAKRNSTNIKFLNLFFHQIGATGENSYVVDTLSPNGVPGDYSIDDSEFIGCNWLGGYGGAIRLASSEIKIDGGKMSFIGLDLVNPMISLGNGTSLNLTDFVFTGSLGYPIKADSSASVGRVNIIGCYTESTDKPIYSHSGGTCRMLNISGGYFSGLVTGVGETFVLFNNVCRGQLQMNGVTFQSDGYKIIDLGEAGSYIGDAQTSTTSYKSYMPRVRNGTFSERKMAIQTTQDGTRKRFMDAKYDQLCNQKLQLFVGNTDDFTRLRFLTIKEALRYLDQSGYTECEVQIPAGTHEIDAPFVFAGEVVFVGAGSANTTINITQNVVVRSSVLSIRSCTLNYIDGAIVNKGGIINLISCVLTAANDSTYLIDHHNGDTLFSSCDFVTAGSGVSINNLFRSTGSINYYSTVFTNNNAMASDSVSAMCRVKFVGNSYPTAGFWRAGSLNEPNTPAVGNVSQFICTVAGTPGTWKATTVVSA